MASITRLPPSLPPQLLGKILSYARNQRRLIETDLEKETGWERRASSDEDFYCRLHEFLQDANSRDLFYFIASKHSKKRRLDLPGAIIKYYSRKYPGVFADDIEIMIQALTPDGFLELLARNDDPECFSNVGWALLEMDELDFDDVIALCDEYSELGMSLRDFVQEYADEVTGLDWAAKLDNIYFICDQMSPKVVDVQLAYLLQDAANRMAEFAESEQEEFWKGFGNELSENQYFIAKHEQYFPIGLQSIWKDKLQVFFADWRPQLAYVQQGIANCEKIDRQINEINRQFIESNFEEQKALLQSIEDLFEKKQKHLRMLKISLSSFLSYSENEDETDRDQFSDDADSPGKTDEDQTDTEFQTSAEDAAQTVKGDDLPPQNGSETAEEPPDDQPPQNGSETAEEPPDENKSAGLDDAVQIVKAESSIPAIEITADEDEAELEISAESKAAKLLDRLFKEGKFSLAYHVAKLSGEFDANVLGVLAEGANVKPGSSCSGRLAEFIDESANGKEWSNDENLLLGAAIVQPLLFLKPYPDSLWQLASIVPTTPITEVVESFRNIFLPQGITLGPRSIQLESEETGLEEKLLDLSEQASELRERIMKTKFHYAPAERALRHLYRADSVWHKLHRIVEANKKQRVQQVSKILSKLDPSSEIKTMHHSIPECKQLEGVPRRKILDYLHSSKKLADEWVEIIETAIQDKPLRTQRQTELKQSMMAGLENALELLQKNEKNASPASHAVRLRFLDLLSILKGNKVEHTDIDEACIRIPGIKLNEDMLPEETNSDSLVEAINSFLDQEYDPMALLDELIENDEFDRASRFVKIEELDENAEEHLSQCLKKRCDELNRRFDHLRIKIEEAFRLGQLWNSEEDANDVPDSNIRSRTELLSLVSEGRKSLDFYELSPDKNILATAKLADQLELRMEEITEEMISHLKSEQSIIKESFADTSQGKDDRNFFSQKFDEYLELQNFVTAFDLLERARNAVAKRQPIARTAPTELSEHFLKFLKFTEKYQEKLRRYGFSRFKEAIYKKETKFSIQLGSIDDVSRDEALSALSIWKDIKNSADVAEVCRFIGFPVIEVRSRSTAKNKNRLQHYEAKLKTAGLKSPLPGFGSALNSKLDIVVCNRSQEAEQIIEFMDQSHRSQSNAVLVLITRMVSRGYRLKWLSECVKSRKTMLPLDTSLLMYLCGERNRRSVLLDIGLPFTWEQPYITQGERVAREMFVGRTNEVSNLIDPDGCCVVFGGRQLGKSALLTHVRRELHDPHREEGQFIEYLDVNDLGEPQSPEDMGITFWKRVLENLEMSGAIERSGKPVRQRRAFNWSDYVSGLIESTLRKFESRRIILLLDETDKLLDLDSQLDFQLVRQIRSLMAKTERRFKVVLAGLQSVQRYHHWKNHPFAQLGGEIVINPLEPKAAEDLIIRPFRALGFQFKNADLVSRICSISNYHPGLIQIFCHQLLENLYNNYSQWNKPNRYVTEDDVLTIEHNPSFNQEVCDRFNWTLDLDYRYKVVTYGLVLSARPTDAKNIDEFRELGEYWWHKVFSQMDDQAMMALLNEMVGLGVLIKDEGFARKYRLRSPNLLRLLSPEDAIVNELLRIGDIDELRQPNPRNFHDLINDDEPASFGPLTKEQLGHISNTNEIFSVTLIIGNTAMGLHELPDQIDKAMIDSVGADEKEWKKIEFSIRGGLISGKQILSRLKKQLRPYKRNHRYAIISLGELFSVENLGNFIDTLLNELKKVCRKKSRGKVVIILDPDWAWKWMCSDYRPQIKDQNNFTEMTLRHWSDGAISNALDRIHLRTGSRATGEEIYFRTAGVHSLVSKTLLETYRRRNGEPIEISKEVKQSVLETEKESFLSELGVSTDKDAGRAIVELFSLSESVGDEIFITEDSFDLVQEEFPDFFADHEASFKSWLRALDLIYPEDNAKSKFKPCPLTLEIINSL